MRPRTCSLPKLFMVLCCLSFFFLGEVQAQGFLRAEGKQIVNGQNQPVILRGMGLGGWMLQEGYMLRTAEFAGQQHRIKAKMEELIGQERTQEFYNAWLQNHTRKIDIDSMAAWGFNSVRLPMHFNLYTLPVEQEPVAGQNTWLEKGFQMTDSLLQWCKANRMYLILDLHAAPGGQGNDNNISDRDPAKPSLWDSEANKQKTIALWRKLAERYKDDPWIGAYDIINEPNWGFQSKEDKNGCAEKDNAPLRQLMVDITKAIREVDQRHLIFIEGNCWGNNYNGVMPVWDKNMGLSFHKYWNYNDLNAIKGWLDLRDQHNVPIWLGETGENSNVWFRQAIELVEGQGIGWAWWPLKKLGFNNPLEVPMTPGYQKLLTYWQGKGPKPSADEAYAALMELTENLKLENNLYHHDVVDAMFRQVKSTETVPFGNYSFIKKLTIPAVNYDLGRNGFAYLDKDTANYYISIGGPRTPWNRGTTYRNDGVDIAQDSVSGKFFVNHIETGEWLQYTTAFEENKAIAGTLKLLVASDTNTSKLTLTVNGDVVKAGMGVPNTGGPKKWKSVTLKNIPLKPGKNVFRLIAEQGGFQLQSLEISVK
ncbi:cellulase family glycosylhydrolase [Sabulibacter ruber]|uniref:cellulase family glycosylhydrolase n=1 Tax=Sabulibacter ruber TaxID=2811901 RepID=UPI001F610EB3|nr:cellulase family glycosylhydrolase [Sabulibacter ruber]